MEGIKREGRWAPLKNVKLCNRGIERALNRDPNLPGITVHYGPSGYGKSMAASYCANKHEGIYVECRSYFTRKTFVEAILHEMGIRPGRTIAEMMEQVAEQLDRSNRPLIVDEMDHLVDRNALEIVRDLHEMARCTMLLIGEEMFPQKLKRRSERFHNRVLVWVPAQPASRDDARQLAQYYCVDKDGRPIDVADDLLEHFRKGSRAVARVICTNLADVREHCLKEGIKKIDLEAWGKRPLNTGDAPARESVRETARESEQTLRVVK